LKSARLACMKKFLILQSRPEKETADAEYASLCRDTGLSPENIERVRAPLGEKPRDETLKMYAGIIAGGGPYNMCDTLEDRKNIYGRILSDSVFDMVFQRILKNDIPTLAICYSLGFLSHVCSIKMEKNERQAEFGTVKIHLTEEGEKDPLLKGLPKTFTAFSGHKESCPTLPQGALLLAQNTRCKVQMYRMKKNIYATQFHPELDIQNVLLFIAHYKNHGYFPKEKAEDYARTFSRTTFPEPVKILRNFIEKYQG
jgi:GMP synthase (glutamine-hydrolysing)